MIHCTISDKKIPGTRIVELISNCFLINSQDLIYLSWIKFPYIYFFIYTTSKFWIENDIENGLKNVIEHDIESDIENCVQNGLEDDRKWYRKWYRKLSWK